ncbi:hypothetical protein TRIUR3_07561 [Triticum urartu]|uniref:Uncharacterized protein n=1 Tax=Triticum urartu TaxID=4572 RepID=M7YPH3_TRIUA|nr:hypothetical protein TRIUR3_07561 [Triticum urartu]
MSEPLCDTAAASLSRCRRRHNLQAMFSALQVGAADTAPPTDEADCVSVVAGGLGQYDISGGGSGPEVRIGSKGGAHDAGDGVPAHAAEVGAGANEEAAPLQQRLFFYPVPRDLTGVFVAVPQRPPPAKKMLAHTLSLVPAVQHSAPACMLVCASPRHIVATASAGKKMLANK